jgi:type II secretory ATPase GspE/PulE/Tfp pilus assembly ATPase PilB-like protein
MPKQKSFLDFLVEKKIIDTTLSEDINKKSQEANNDVEELILERGLIKEDALYNFKSQFLKIPYKDLSDLKIEPEIFKLVPLEAVHHYRFVPLALDKDKKTLEAGMLNPSDVNAKEALKFIAHRNNLTPKIFIIGITDFKKILKEYSSLKGEVKEALDQLKQEIVQEKQKTPATNKEQIEKIAEEAPISKVVALIIK